MMNLHIKKLLSSTIAAIIAVGLMPGYVHATEAESAAATIKTTDVFAATRTDFRDESIYNLIITRFYDGDSSNNVHCWDDGQANNPDSDPGWRGDFKGLIEKLDYIKALGFTAVQLNPVSQNASGYDYHGEHPMDLKSIDVRYGSDDEGYTYQDLINACHAKGLKVIQEVQINSTSNFGEAYLSEMFELNTAEDADFGTLSGMLVPKKAFLDAFGLSSAEEYWEQDVGTQYQQRLHYMKNTTYTSEQSNTTGALPDTADYADTKLSKSEVYNPNNYYHTGYFQSLNWDNWTNKYAQVAGDSVDINTENPIAGKYLAESLKMYADYGVDAIYIDSARRMNRLSLNLNVIQPLKEMLAEDGQQMDIFADVETRYEQIWYREHATESTPFYTWADDAKWAESWKTDGSAESVNNNMNLSFDFIKETDDVTNQPTSSNAFLSGITYHTPDYSNSSGVNVFDFQMHRLFSNAADAFRLANGTDSTTTIPHGI